MTYTKICPKCGSTRISQTGSTYGLSDYCKKCGFTSTLFPETDDVEKFRKELKKV